MTRMLDPVSGQVVDVDDSVAPLVEELWARLGLPGDAVDLVAAQMDAARQLARADGNAAVKLAMRGAEATRQAWDEANAAHQAALAEPAPSAASGPAPRRKRPPARLIVPWQPAQLGRVRSGLPARYQLMCDLGAALGLRQGELFGFNLEDLDQRAYRIRVQVKRVDGVLVFAAPKHERERSVPVPASLHQAITAHAAEHGTTRVTLPWERPGGQPRTLTLAFTNQHRAPLGRAYLNRLWKTAVLAAGIAWIPQDTGMHMLRHVAASRWIAEPRATTFMVRDLLGHADTATTERYLHRLKTHDQRTRNVVAKAQRRTAPRPARLPAGVADFGAYRTRRTS